MTRPLTMSTARMRPVAGVDVVGAVAVVADRTTWTRRSTSLRTASLRTARPNPRRMQRLRGPRRSRATSPSARAAVVVAVVAVAGKTPQQPMTCLLYTSDAADEEDSVDLGG